MKESYGRLIRSTARLGPRARPSLQATPGSVGNLRLIDSGEIESGFAQADLAGWAHNGVKLFAVGIEVEPSLMNLGKGERNRFALHLPRPEGWKAARKVVITNG